MFLTISKFLESYREALASVLPPVKRMAISPTDFVLHRLSLILGNATLNNNDLSILLLIYSRFSFSITIKIKCCQTTIEEFSFLIENEWKGMICWWSRSIRSHY